MVSGDNGQLIVPSGGQNAFDEMGVKKLPKVREPGAEYAKVAGGKEENLR